ncbi:MAG: OmpA family protein [Methylocella sp.]
MKQCGDYATFKFQPLPLRRPEGILISLTDDANYSMFAIGSAEPQPETVQIMGKIGQILKSGSGSIVIRGHTDGRPYRSAIYDNWRLSSARAHMALYMLARGGLSEKRIEYVEGFADHHLKSPNNPSTGFTHPIMDFPSAARFRSSGFPMHSDYWETLDGDRVGSCGHHCQPGIWAGGD